MSDHVNHGGAYTPDWLAEYVLESSGYDGNPDLRVLDPACGSGTFLVVIIKKIRSWFAANRHSCGFGEARLLAKILSNVSAFDLNPLAVMAARVNFLLSIRDLLRFSSAVDLPVFLSDSILTPASHGSLFTGKLGAVRQIKTSVGELYVPTEVSDSSGVLSKYTELLERAVKSDYRWDDFRILLKNEAIPTDDIDAHQTLFKQLSVLQASGRNGIWARIIRNAFAPIFLKPVDFILGKTKGIKQVEAAVDTALVYPLLRGRDVAKWMGEPSCHIVLTQDAATRTPIAESVMKTRYAKTFAYLYPFREKLKGRSGYKRYFARKGGAPFYALYNVGPYTLAPWKVLWPEVGHSVRAGVVGPQDGKPAIPDHTLIFVGCTTEQEAHFICGVLNSAPVDLLVRGYIALHPSPHVLETAKVPRFDVNDKSHVAIARLSSGAHIARSHNDVAALDDIELSLHSAVANLFGIDDLNLRACIAALEEFKGSGTLDAGDDEDVEDLVDSV